MLRAPRFRIAAAAVLAGLAVTAGVLLGGAGEARQGGGRRGGVRSAETHAQALGRTADQRARFAAGSADEGRALDAVRALFADLARADIGARAAATYAPDAYFDDTLTTLRGAEDIGRYFASHVERLIAAAVVFDDVTAADGEYYLRWRMTVAARGLADGRPVSTIGMSHLRFDAEGRVLFHQDYWDSTRGLFEHVPVVGWAIRRIKSRF